LLAARPEPGDAFVAVVVLDDFVLMLQTLDGVNTVDGDAVDLDAKPVGEVEVALGLGAALQLVAIPGHSHFATSRLPPSGGFVHCPRFTSAGFPLRHWSRPPPPPRWEPGPLRAPASRYRD